MLQGMFPHTVAYIIQPSVVKYTVCAYANSAATQEIHSVIYLGTFYKHIWASAWKNL